MDFRNCAFLTSNARFTQQDHFAKFWTDFAVPPIIVMGLKLILERIPAMGGELRVF